MPFLTRLCHTLEENGVDYAIVGGYAVALHGAIRSTVDIDFIIRWNKESLIKAEKVLNRLGLVSQHPLTASMVFQQRDQLMSEKQLIAWHFYNPENPAESVDILINSDLASFSTVDFMVQNERIHVISRKDLITMKKAAGRKQDLEDIAALEKQND